MAGAIPTRPTPIKRIHALIGQNVSAACKCIARLSYILSHIATNSASIIAILCKGWVLIPIDALSFYNLTTIIASMFISTTPSKDGQAILNVPQTQLNGPQIISPMQGAGAEHIFLGFDEESRAGIL